MSDRIIHEPTVSEFRRMALQLGYEKVVQCKDCKYQKNGYCHTPLGAHCVPPVSILVDDEDFCSGGKRKEETD